jgi:hypothetical protein
MIIQLNFEDNSKENVYVEKRNENFLEFFEELKKLKKTDKELKSFQIIAE